LGSEVLRAFNAQSDADGDRYYEVGRKRQRIRSLRCNVNNVDKQKIQESALSAATSRKDPDENHSSQQHTKRKISEIARTVSVLSNPARW
jgi:hypothetical protein